MVSFFSNKKFIKNKFLASNHRELKEKQYYAGTLGRDQARRILLELSSPGQFLVRDRAGKADVHQAPYGKILLQSTP
jgi:hypothetical protein